MEELFNGIDLNDDTQIEIDAAPAQSGLETNTTELDKDNSSVSQKSTENQRDENLIEIDDSPKKSSLNGETKKTSLSEEISSFSDEIDIKQEKGTPEDASDKTSSSSPTPVIAFAKVLADEGVLSSFDDETKSILEEKGVEGLIELVSFEIQEGVEDYKKQLPQEIKDLIDNYEEGVPFDKILTVKSKQIEVNNISDSSLEDDINLQKNIVRQELTMRGYKEQEVDEMIVDFEDLGKLESKAKVALGKLKESYKEQQIKMQEEVKEYQKQLEQQKAQQLEKIQKTIENTEEVIPGIKLSKKDKDVIYKSMTTVVSTSENGQPMNAVMAMRAKNPIEFEKRLHYFTALGFFDEKADFSKIVATAKTSATKELEKVLSSNRSFKTGGADNFRKESKNDLLKSLNQFNKDK